MDNNANFGKYGRHFQECTMQALLTDHKWAEQMMEVFDTSYFDVKYLSFLADRYFAHWSKYKTFPSLSGLVTIIKEDLTKGSTDQLLRDQIIEYLKRIKTSDDLSDLPYTKEKALEFCRKQALKQALEKAVDHMQEEKYEQIVEVIKKAVNVGTVPNIGHDFFQDTDARFIEDFRECVPTGFKELDQQIIFNGGLGKGELGVVVAPTGVGKCVFSRTIIPIRYEQIKINGQSYKPWDKINTQRGTIYAKDIKEVERSLTEEDIEIGDLFEQLGFTQDSSPTDDDGDSVIINEFDIDVLSDAGFNKIEALRWTKPEQQVVISFEGTSRKLQCSPRHVVARFNSDDERDWNEWTYVEELKLGDLVIERDGVLVVKSIDSINDIERLCDMQVSNVHRYYTEGILSHNSHMLTWLGHSAMRAGVNVVHYTLELSEKTIGLRYDSCLCDIDSNLIIQNKEKVLQMYGEMNLGKLIIKQYPMNFATVYTLRAHLEKLYLQNFKPGLILIDYADVMRSTRQYDSVRHELKLIYEELRSFAVEEGYPIWTACFHGDTVIKTPCGDMKIRDLVGTSGFPVYSYNHESGRVELRTVKSVYESGKQVEVWKVTLDNGESVTVTPNHKFMKRDGTYCEVRNLSVGDSLMPFNERISSGSMPGRKQVYRNDGTWEFVYKMVAEWKWGTVPKYHQIHHKDFDKTNDHPNNLELLTISEHYNIHSSVSWDPQVPCSLAHLRDAFSERMKLNNPMFNDISRNKMKKNRKGKCVGNDNPMRLIENKNKVSNSLQSSTKFAEYKKRISSNVSHIWRERNEEERKRIGAKIQLSRYGCIREERIKRHVLIATECETFDEFKKKTSGIPLRSDDKRVIWKNRNHKVVSIEPCGYADVFNMEVDELHNYAIGAGIIVKNSQSNKEGSESDVVDLSNMSEAYGKAFVADVVLSVSRRTHEKATGQGRIYIAKNRAGRDGLVYPIKIDTARSKFEIVGGVTTPDYDAPNTDQQRMKDTIKRRIEEIHKNTGLELKELKNDAQVSDEDKSE